MFVERAQVTIFKSPFSIDVAHWSRGAHYFPDDKGRDQEGRTAARVDFEVDTIELVTGVAAPVPVFS